MRRRTTTSATGVCNCLAVASNSRAGPFVTNGCRYTPASSGGLPCLSLAGWFRPTSSPRSSRFSLGWRLSSSHRRRLPRVRLPSSTCSSANGQVLDGTGARGGARRRRHRAIASPPSASSRRGPRGARSTPRARRRARLHRSPHPLGDAAPRRRHGAEQGAPGRDARHHGREHVGRAARRLDRRRAATASAPDWTTFTGYFARLEKQGISINVISHVASEQVRRVVIGYDARRPTPQELERMTRARRAIDGGRRVGSGDALRERRPRASATKCIEMAEVVAALRRQLHVAHRQRGLRAEEGVRVRDPRRRGSEDARSTSSTSRSAASRYWGTIGQYITQIEEARARGLNITANQYPYTAMFHGWSAFFPLWIREGGPAKFAERLQGSGRARAA